VEGEAFLEENRMTVDGGKEQTGGTGELVEEGTMEVDREVYP